MQKRNKIMMATVAILLSLVLITTSIVSTTFAKYVSQKYIEGSFDIDAFDVTVGMKLSDEFKEAINSDYAGQTDDKSITLTLNSMKLKPGDSYLDAVKLSVSGTPSVPVRVTLDLNVTLDMAEFKILEDDFPTLTFDKFDTDYFLPIEFSFNAYDASGNSKASVSEFILTRTDVSGAEENICSTVSKKINFDFGDNGSDSDFWLYKDFNKSATIEFHPVTVNSVGEVVSVNEAIDLNNFAFGFSWPEYSSSAIPNFTEDEYNAISTWLVEHNDPAITVSYTVTVEQDLS